VSAWIASRNGLVSSARHKTVPKRYHTPDRHLALFRGGLRLGNCQFHVGEVIHLKFAISFGARNRREKILNDGDIPETIAVAGMFFVNAYYPPSRGSAKSQTVLVVRKDPPDEFAVSQPRRLCLSYTHQLTANPIAAKGASHEYDNFGDLAVVQPFFVSLNGNDAANQIPHFSDEQATLGILPCRGNQAFLIFDGAQATTESRQSVFDSIVTDFAKSRRIVLTRRPDVQMRTLFGSAHRVILTSELS
jgi:hypothetical protein